MCLTKAILTHAEYNARTEALAEQYPFLRDCASSICVPPGWITIVEDLLKVLAAISGGKIDFVRIDRHTGMDTLTVFIETPLEHGSGRYDAIKHEIDKARTLVSEHKSCSYCGVDLDDEESGTGKCKDHKRVVSGWYADDVKYGAESVNSLDGEAIERDGVRFIKPDPLKMAIDTIRAVLSQLRETNKKGADKLEAAIIFINRMQWKDLVAEAGHDIERAEVIENIEEAFKKEPEPKRTVATVDASGRAFPTMQICDMKDIELMWGKNQSKDRRQVIEPYYKAMKEGTSRYFAIVSESWSEDLDALALDFPNFGEVIGFLRQQFALAAMGDGRVHFPPLLLNGPAGVGKTFMAKTLASMIRTSYVEIHMESEQNNSALTGSSAFWSNTNPGKIADVLLLKDAANPIVVVDELDKAAGDSRYDPLSGLYSLLEPSTSVGFEDLCLGIPMNASAICWIMTSNRMEGIPLPIMSRLKVFNVPAPTIEQVEHIARRIYASLLKSHWGSAFDPELPDAVVEALGLREPRVIRNTLLSALGNAAIDGRSRLEAKDMDGMPKLADGRDYNRSKIGFSGELK